jgi:hypothetical protein
LDLEIALSGVPAKVQPHELLQLGRRCVETSDDVIENDFTSTPDSRLLDFSPIRLGAAKTARESAKSPADGSLVPTKNSPPFLSVKESRAMTVIEIKPHRNGWKVFEAPGVGPVFLERDQAINYAKNRAWFRSGEIRILDYRVINPTCKRTTLCSQRFTQNMNRSQLRGSGDER